MAHHAEKIYVGGRLVKVAYGTYGGGTKGRTQTINVCTPANMEGEYEQVYRLPMAGEPLALGDLGNNARTVAELDVYLISLGATREGSRSARRGQAGKGGR